MNANKQLYRKETQDAQKQVHDNYILYIPQVINTAMWEVLKNNLPKIKAGI